MIHNIFYSLHIRITCVPLNIKYHFFYILLCVRDICKKAFLSLFLLLLLLLLKIFIFKCTNAIRSDNRNKNDLYTRHVFHFRLKKKKSNTDPLLQPISQAIPIDLPPGQPQPARPFSIFKHAKSPYVGETL